MAIWKFRSKRKVSGGKYNKIRDKRKSEIGREPALTTIGETKKSEVRMIGGEKKVYLLRHKSANVYDPKTKKFHKLEIKTVSENNANRNYIRRNIMTRGAIIGTEMGKARITNKPGQEGAINAVLIENK
jgi:small subunit ribosomal protein S8e